MFCLPRLHICWVLTTIVVISGANPAYSNCDDEVGISQPNWAIGSAPQREWAHRYEACRRRARGLLVESRHKAQTEKAKREKEVVSASSRQKPEVKRPDASLSTAPKLIIDSQGVPPIAAVGESASFKRRVALVIGNAAYRYAPALTNPTNDESDVVAVLHKLNFDVVEGTDLDKQGMENAIKQFGHKLDNADLALFFYSGHGLQVDGKNYLVPVDAKLERTSELSFDAIDMRTVLAQMESERRVNLVFLDACRDNPLARSLSRSIGSRSVSVGQGLGAIEGSLGTMISFSTQPDNVALDGAGRNSPFTAALLRHLAEPGIDIGVVMRRVRADVISATHQKQIPWDHSSLTGEVILAN